MLRQRFESVVCAASDAAAPKRRDIEKAMPFSYNSSDGRRKASLEDALSRDGQNKNRSVLMDQQPWRVGWQVAERNLLWNNDVAAGLVKVAYFTFLMALFEDCRSLIPAKAFSL